MALALAPSDHETPYYCNAPICLHHGELHWHCACGVRIDIDEGECGACEAEKRGHLPSALDPYEWLTAAQKIVVSVFTLD